MSCLERSPETCRPAPGSPRPGEERATTAFGHLGPATGLPGCGQLGDPEGLLGGPISVYSLGNAGIAQSVEHKLPKLGVASSNLVSRSESPPEHRYCPKASLRSKRCRTMDDRWGAAERILVQRSARARMRVGGHLLDGQRGTADWIGRGPQMGTTERHLLVKARPDTGN